MNYLFVLSFILLTILFVGGGLIVSRWVAPRFPGGIKNDPYECGEKSFGSAWVHYHIGYYLLALLFLVFDVEAIFLFPWALAMRELGFVGLFEVGLFIFVLLLALLYSWKRGVLEWR